MLIRNVHCHRVKYQRQHNNGLLLLLLLLFFWPPGEPPCHPQATKPRTEDDRGIHFGPHPSGSESTKKLLHEVLAFKHPAAKTPHAFRCPTSPALVHCFSPATIPRSCPGTDRCPRSHLLHARPSSLHCQQRADGGIIQ